MTGQEDVFDACQEGRRPAGRGAWLLLGLVLIVGALVGAGAGYGLARGAWVIPGAVATRLPEPVAAWLPKSAPPMPPELKDYAFELLDPGTGPLARRMPDLIDAGGRSAIPSRLAALSGPRSGSTLPTMPG